MSITLTQTSTAAFPDRPATGGMGLLIDATPGEDGAVLSKSMGASARYQRLMFAPGTLADGRIVLARTLDADGGQTSAVTFDAIQRRVTVAIGQTQLSADLPPHIGWHCLSFGVDEQAAQSRLWVNGVLADAAVSAETDFAVDAAQIGGVYRDPQLSGQAFVDEWAIDDEYLPPVLVAPASDYADDPARWLVVYNTASNDSCAWAETYRAARGVPYANLLGLALSLNETISEAAFAALKQSVNDYLSSTGLSTQVLGILCGYSVPGYFTYGALTESVAAHLQRTDGSEMPAGNALLSSPLARPDALNMTGHRMTARIDAPTLAEAIAMHDRALTVEAGGLDDGEEAALYLDPVTTGGAGQTYMQSMIDWAAGVERQLLRLPMQITEATDPPSEVNFESIRNDGFFWGWREAEPGPGFFGEPAGKRVLCVQLYDLAATAPTLRDAQGTNWALAAMAAGYAITAGASGSVSVSALPVTDRFFEGLRLGWAVGEAWFAASPILRDGLTLIGDPLMRVPFPRAGWNLYGPFGSWPDVHCQTPCAALRESETTLTLPTGAQLQEGQTGIYIVRHVDAAGREEQGSAHVHVQLHDGVLVTPPALPMLGEARPDGAAWRLAYIWPRRLGDLHVAAVALVEQVQGQSEQVVAEADLAVQSPTVVLSRTPAGEVARYRLRVTSQEGGVSMSTWSRWLQVRPAEMVALQEVTP